MRAKKQTPSRPCSDPKPQIGALVPWYGSNRQLAHLIVDELTRGRTIHSYWEPCCGSMATALAMPDVRMTVVNDLHGDLINLARCMADRQAGLQLYRGLRAQVFSDKAIEAAQKYLRTVPLGHGINVFKYSGGPRNREGGLIDLMRASAYFVASWMGRNGISGTRGECSGGLAVRYHADGGQGAKRYASAVQSIPQFRRRLQKWNILSRDGLQLIRKIADKPGQAVYVDPPFVEKTAEYLHDFRAADHQEWAAALNRFHRARVVVRYYDHPTVRELFRGWTVLKVDARKNMCSAHGASRTPAPEILLMNGPSVTAEKK